MPCVLLSFDDEQILMWRGREWKSMYKDEVPKIQLPVVDGSSAIDTSGTNGTMLAYELDLHLSIALQSFPQSHMMEFNNHCSVF